MPVTAFGEPRAGALLSMVRRLLPTSSNLSPAKIVGGRIGRGDKEASARDGERERAGVIGKRGDGDRLGRGAPGHLHHGGSRKGVPSTAAIGQIASEPCVGDAADASVPGTTVPLRAMLPEVRRVLPARSRVSKYQGTLAPMFWMALEPSSADTVPAAVDLGEVALGQVDHVAGHHQPHAAWVGFGIGAATRAPGSSVSP